MEDRAAAERQPHRWGSRPFLVRTLAIAAIYFGAAKLGLTMGVAPQVTAVWPPTGIALTAVLMLGAGIWPGIALGAFLANATTHDASGTYEPVWTAAGIAVGNTLEALVGAWLLRRVVFQTSLDRLRDVLALVVLAAVLSTTVSATVGVTTLCLGGVHPWAAFGLLWWVWWIGDAMGDIVMAPLLLVWWTRPPARLPPRRAAEGAVLVGSLVLLSLIVFAGRFGMPVTGYPLHYTIFPFVIWAALRFGQRGTTAVTFCASTVAIWSTVNGWGPFATATANGSLVQLQLFMAVVAVTALLLGAAISERNRAERRRAADYARLETSEQRLRVALEGGRLGVWDWDVATGEVKWSENLEPIHGLAPGSFPGTLEGFQALVHPEDRELLDGAIAGAVERGTDYDIEFRNLWPDGSVHWMAAKGTVLRDGRGRPVRMIGVGMDVTGRRRLEEELKQRARQLAEADRRKDEFLAMLAHELRNPLTPLSTALHLLRLERDDRERFLEMANRQVKQLARLVDDLLDVSRITQGKITLRKEPVVLGDIATRAVETIRPLVDSRGHEFVVSLPVEPIWLDADPARLAQVLGNLLSNSAKYTPSGGTIRLTAERLHDEVVIHVRDTGMGLPPELLPHVFDLFVQADTSLDRARGGLGIGLTIVRRLVELHGGRVEAHSAGLGQGSEFVVRLPAAAGPPAESIRAVRRPEGSPAAGLKVLVVEDNQDAAESLTTVLKLWGHDVQLAYDGLAALRVVEREKPDVILSDVGLPGMDGYALARRLREHPGLGEVVLVALSGYGREEDKRLALEAGFDEHLVKPLDLEALAELLGRVGARSSRRSSLA